MNIKTYQAATMQDALKAIKAELGPDAVILSTKPHPRGKSPGCKMVEVTAAIDREATRVRVPTKEHTAAYATSLSTGHAPYNHVQPFGEVLRESLRQHAQPLPTEPKRPHAASADPAREEDWDSLHAELKRIRELLDSRGNVSMEQPPLMPALRGRYERLIESGLEARTIRELLRDIELELPTAASDECIRNLLHQTICRQVKTSGSIFNNGERKKTVIVVGPTGVGKTTTIAKLAAYYRQHERRSVALVTLDTYRVAAVDQLRMYADLIGVTMDVALTRGDAVRCIARRTDAELILVDTAGRSPRDGVGMTEVRDLLSLNHPVEVHLVLSATTRERDLMQHTNQYRGIPFNRLLFTKLDETTGVGGAFDLMRKTGVPLSYFSVGQRVPEDLELARPERLADWLLSESGPTPKEPARAGIVP